MDAHVDIFEHYLMLSVRVFIIILFDYG